MVTITFAVNKDKAQIKNNLKIKARPCELELSRLSKLTKARFGPSTKAPALEGAGCEAVVLKRNSARKNTLVTEFKCLSVGCKRRLRTLP